MAAIKEVRGIEIIDSRGDPTVAATDVLESGASSGAAAPSRASTGSREADPTETTEWLDALKAVQAHRGVARPQFLLGKLREGALRTNSMPPSVFADHALSRYHPVGSGGRVRAPFHRSATE